ncbi:MAG: EscU/YscU/HrcU family type III secretion system export apparatus switch protein, partial [bacterium]
MYRVKLKRGGLILQGNRVAQVSRRTIDLQLFAQEKTEPATPRRREEARRKGQVFKSQELASALLLMAAFAGLYLFFPYMVGEFQKLVVWVYSQQPEQLVSIAGLSGIVVTVVLSFLRLTFPLLTLVLVVGLISNVSQTGFVLSGEPLRFKLERINPVEGFKRIFSRRALVQLIKSLAK